MPVTVHRPLKSQHSMLIALGARPKRSENSCKTKIGVALFSETNLKPHIRFYIPNYDICSTNGQAAYKGGPTVAAKKGISHFRRLTSSPSVEATGISIPIGNTEIFREDCGVAQM
jgi:hypothetical protein